MALQTPGAFFLGTLVPSEQKYIKVLLENARKQGFNKVIEPCCGAFAMSHLAIQAGFKPEQIQASDVTMFSSVMGYALMDKPLNDLEIKATGFSDEELLDPATALYALMYLKTMMTAGSDFFYAMLKDLELRREEHINKIQEQLDRGKALLKGFSYRPLDMFDHIEEVIDDEKAVIIANPPTYTAGFEKWYGTGGNMTWKEPEYRIFDPKTGLTDLFEVMNRSKALIVCYEENETKKMAGKAIFSRYGVRKGINVYLTTNHEEKAEALANGKLIVRPNESKMSPLDCSTLPTDYEITENSKIEFMQVEPQYCQYYRGIWTHNFVGGQAQVNVVMLIDRYVAGVFGYQLAIGAMVLKDLLIMFGITVPMKNYRLGRLLTMLACNRQTLKALLTDYQISRLQGIQTTQITKYPESKEMRGVMKLTSKEKGKLGYKLIYKTEIQERTKEETLKLWLQKEATWKKERAKTKSQFPTE
ncbi:MAG: hypothetical protein ACK5M3_05465 [Dysgonomonas sp.]